MEESRTESECEGAGYSMGQNKTHTPQEPKSYQDRQHAYNRRRAVCDNCFAQAVVREARRKCRSDCGGDNVSRQHEQALPHTVAGYNLPFLPGIASDGSSIGGHSSNGA